EAAAFRSSTYPRTGTCRCPTKTARSGSPTTARSTTLPTCGANWKTRGTASHTDTEVVVHAYEEFGEDCVTHFSGMFAFAICDLRGASPVLFMARDHFGVKPFYYSLHAGRLAFASEAKALLEVPGIGAEIDLQALDQYLHFLWVPDPKTLFK